MAVVPSVSGAHKPWQWCRRNCRQRTRRQRATTGCSAVGPGVNCRGWISQRAGPLAASSNQSSLAEVLCMGQAAQPRHLVDDGRCAWPAGHGRMVHDDDLDDHSMTMHPAGKRGAYSAASGGGGGGRRLAGPAFNRRHGPRWAAGHVGLRCRGAGPRLRPGRRSTGRSQLGCRWGWGQLGPVRRQAVAAGAGMSHTAVMVGRRRPPSQAGDKSTHMQASGSAGVTRHTVMRRYGAKDLIHAHAHERTSNRPRARPGGVERNAERAVTGDPPPRSRGCKGRWAWFADGGGAGPM